MKLSISALFLMVAVSGFGSLARAEDDKEVDAILAKAINALGGEQKLSSMKAASVKGQGLISFGGDDSKFTMQTTVQGLDQFRQDFEGDFMGTTIKGVTVLNGAKGWRKFADMVMELDADGVANEKRSVYLSATASSILPLKGKGFKVESAPEEKVAGKPTAVLKITPADGKVFTMYFDKDSGLPVKQVAKVVGFDGAEFTQETRLSNYKDFDGIKKATQVENLRDGEKFLSLTVTEFKVLDKADPKLFAEPK
jgi:hypothetical protein